jgi:carbon-monoxide dehydrogenase large subunit
MSGVGRSVPRREDERYLRGQGEFVADLAVGGMQELAFVRSPVAHAYVRKIRKPAGMEKKVFVAADLVGVAPITCLCGLPGFRASSQPILAWEKVRHVGEALAVCVAASRAEAEDLASAVEIELEEISPVADMMRARDGDAPRVHEDWPDNVFLTTRVEADFSTVRATAPIVVRRTLQTARQCMSPIEGRGVVAVWERRAGQLVLHSATQMPHVVRTGLAGCLGLSEAQIRVIAPDVGGGFGYKGILLPEEVCAGFLARWLGHPVRWLEDRREQLAGNANCREHFYDLTAYADVDGRLIGLEAEAIVDAGAYSAYPFSACLEGAQVASILPGPYMMDAYRCTAWSVATNKPGILPYRGVARAGVCYAMEAIMDGIAAAVGLEGWEVRLKNLVPQAKMPFDNITGKHFDSGDYPQCLRRVVEAVGVEKIRERQAAQSGVVRVGVGLSIFCEQGAHGTSVYHGWGIPMVPGFEQAVARLTADGGLELRVGIQSHGQGLETTLAQVAYEVLGIAIDRIRVVHGDTALTPYSTGTWGSRCMVMSGGAVATSCRELAGRIGRIGAHLLQVGVAEVVVGGGVVRAPKGAPDGASVSIADVARTWYLRPQDLPEGVDRGGLEVTGGYKPARDTGTFSYAAHACVVEVDTETGEVRIADYAVCEDGGVLVNPMIVDGQVLGGIAQGIGTALYEEMPFDAGGQPLATTLAEYLLPSATEVPRIRIDHMETRSPYTEYGQKGIGESGAIGPPAAIANAVNDALRGLGASVDRLPITPMRVLAALRDAKLT